MNVGDSVRLAIDNWGRGELQASMLHACNAVDGTGAKVHPELANSNKRRFTMLLRENYAILGPMAMPGINVVDSRFPVKVDRPTAPGGKPDLADIIYAIHRCTHGHGDELPDGFELLRDAAGPAGYTSGEIRREGTVALSDRVIFGLLAVAVMSPANVGQKVPDGYHFTFGINNQRLSINEWWGRAADFPAIVSTEPPMPNVTLAFTSWPEWA
jgi:hypothetical protein